MPITLNSFKCANGHSFEANAKLRTRCPECGVSTKRSFSAAVADVLPKSDPAPEPVVATPEPVVPAKPKSGPVLIRQGRPRMAVAKKPEPAKSLPKKRTLIGSKVSAGLVKSTTIKRRGVMPTIKKRPVKTAIARGVVGHEQVTPYWHDVAKKYGF